MKKKLELGLCTLLALGGLAHSAGMLAGYESGTEVFVWSLSGTAFILTTVFLHVLRIERPGYNWLMAGGNPQQSSGSHWRSVSGRP